MSTLIIAVLLLNIIELDTELDKAALREAESNVCRPAKLFKLVSVSTKVAAPWCFWHAAFARKYVVNQQFPILSAPLRTRQTRH